MTLKDNILTADVGKVLYNSTSNIYAHEVIIPSTDLLQDWSEIEPQEELSDVESLLRIIEAT